MGLRNEGSVSVGEIFSWMPQPKLEQPPEHMQVNANQALLMQRLQMLRATSAAATGVPVGPD